MKKRSITAIVVALVMSVMAVFALVGCGNSKSGGGDNHAADNSFVGCMSEDSYESAETAARAFLTVEIDGATTTTTFVSCTAGDELTEDEIAELNVGDDIDVAEIDSAVKYTVEYVEGTAASYSVNTSADVQTKTYGIILIKIGTRYFYYIPIMPKGGAITNSYIAMICEPSKYINVTETAVSKTTVTSGGMSMTTTITITTKLDTDKVYFKSVTEVLGQKETTEYYLVKVGDYLTVFELSGGEWRRSGYTNYGSVEELMDDAFNFDHSYFERTDSGFKMIDGKLEEYVNDVMGDSLASIGNMGLSVSGGSANYYAKDGVLYEVNATLNFSGTVQGQKLSATANATTTYTDFGTTEVVLPFTVN